MKIKYKPKKEIEFTVKLSHKEMTIFNELLKSSEKTLLIEELNGKLYDKDEYKTNKIDADKLKKDIRGLKEKVDEAVKYIDVW